MPADARYNFDDDSPAYAASEPPVSSEENGGPPRATGRQPVLLGLFVFLGAATLVFGIVSIGNTIKAPFVSKAPAADDARARAAITGDDALSDESQKKLDTDGDGLSDYDELKTYRTSPYLKDTNSNGYDDRTELITGHDPLLRGGTVAPTAAADSTASGQPADPTAASENPADLLDVMKNPTPQKLRELLLSQGLPQEKIDALTDDALMSLYSESLKDAESKTGAAGGAAAQPSLDASGPSIFDTLGENPPPQRIRDTLLQSGSFTKDQLQSFDDAAILDVYHQALLKHQNDILQAKQQ